MDHGADLPAEGPPLSPVAFTGGLGGRGRGMVFQGSKEVDSNTMNSPNGDGGGGWEGAATTRAGWGGPHGGEWDHKGRATKGGFGDGSRLAAPSEHTPKPSGQRMGHSTLYLGNCYADRQKERETARNQSSSGGHQPLLFRKQVAFESSTPHKDRRHGINRVLPTSGQVTGVHTWGCPKGPLLLKKKV